jgi:hypothetical protein
MLSTDYKISPNNGLLHIEPLWPNSYIPVEKLDVSFLSEAEILCVSEFGQATWDRCTQRRFETQSTEDIGVIDLTYKDEDVFDLIQDDQDPGYIYTSKRIPTRFIIRQLKADPIQGMVTQLSLARLSTLPIKRKIATVIPDLKFPA